MLVYLTHVFVYLYNLINWNRVKAIKNEGYGNIVNLQNITIKLNNDHENKEKIHIKKLDKKIKM